VKILVTGNMGYVGPAVVAELRASRPDATLVGLDTGYFATCLTGTEVVPERLLDAQYFGDVRHLPDGVLSDVDAVVHLAAISNDPIGKAFEEVTYAVNHRATVELARRAKAAGARAFVFASSCSIYGFAEDGTRTESSPVNPLTAYSRSKIQSEHGLEPLADGDFLVTSLRFATACGMSDRVRLDLVLNDFVASAVATGKILILSDGTPWRPLIHVRDMARAIDWAIERDLDKGGPFLAVNTGSDRWNYQVRELAEAVARIVPGVKVEIAADAQPDSRSYKVSFELYEELAPDHQPEIGLDDAVRDLRDGLERMGFHDPDFRKSHLVRLVVLDRLVRGGLVTGELAWTGSRRPTPVELG